MHNLIRLTGENLCDCFQDSLNKLHVRGCLLIVFFFGKSHFISVFNRHDLESLLLLLSTWAPANQLFNICVQLCELTDVKTLHNLLIMHSLSFFFNYFYLKVMHFPSSFLVLYLDILVKTMQFLHETSHVQFFAQKLNVIIDSFLIPSNFLTQQSACFCLLMFFTDFQVLLHRIIALFRGVAYDLNHKLWCKLACQLKMQTQYFLPHTCLFRICSLLHSIVLDSIFALFTLKLKQLARICKPLFRIIGHTVQKLQMISIV